MIHNTKKGRTRFKSKQHGKTRRVQRGGAPIPVIMKGVKIGEYDDDTGIGSANYNLGSYEGQFKDSKRNGQGICRYKSGHVYEGEWVNDRQNGRGIMRYPNGDVYDGEWVNNKCHGEGLHSYSDGKGGVDETYKGEWKNDEMTGHGTYTYKSGHVYEGEWLNAHHHGEGIMTYPDRKKYEGTWWYNNRQGEGTMVYADGTKYEGEWWDDEMHGDGKMTDSNGDIIYEGLWRDNQQNPLFDPAMGKLADNDGYNPPPVSTMRFINSDNMLFTDDKFKHKYQFNDVIYNEERYVSDELKGDPSTIALLLNRTYYVPSRDRLLKLMNDKAMIRYECTKIDKADEFSIDTDVNKTVPYFGLNGIVSNQGGVVPLFDLWAAIDSGHRAFELIKTGRRLLTVASHHVAYKYGSWIGSAHCQSDKDADIYELRILRISEKPRTRSKPRRNARSHPYSSKYSLHPYNPRR
jgi:hypothetical protein